MNNTIQLFFPWGGGGNHIRWLLFLDDKFSNIVSGVNNLDNKLDFLKNIIYNKRDVNDWLKQEIKWRTELLNWPINIDFKHEGVNYNWEYDQEWQSMSCIYLRYDNIQFLLDRYIKINPKLNNITPAEYIKYFEQWHTSELLVIKNRNYANKLIVDADDIFNPVLSERLYMELINFLKLDNLYKQASEIHTLWHNLNNF